MLYKDWQDSVRDLRVLLHSPDMQRQGKFVRVWYDKAKSYAVYNVPSKRTIAFFRPDGVAIYQRSVYRDILAYQVTEGIEVKKLEYQPTTLNQIGRRIAQLTERS